MSTITFVLGMNGKLYQGPAGTALATLTELTNVKDVTVTMEKGEADVTTRANGGWKATVGTLKECTVEFEMVWKPSDTGFQAVKDAFLNNTLVSLAALTGEKATSGSEGPHGDFAITGFSRSEALEEAMTVKVTAKLSVYTAWVNVGGS